MLDPRDMTPLLLTEQDLKALQEDMDEAAAMADEVFAARREGRRHDVRALAEAALGGPGGSVSIADQ